MNLVNKSDIVAYNIIIQLNIALLCNVPTVVRDVSRGERYVGKPILIYVYSM